MFDENVNGSGLATMQGAYGLLIVTPAYGIWETRFDFSVPELGLVGGAIVILGIVRKRRRLRERDAEGAGS